MPENVVLLGDGARACDGVRFIASGLERYAVARHDCAGGEWIKKESVRLGCSVRLRQARQPSATLLARARRRLKP
jgi:hypothetical protein